MGRERRGEGEGRNIYVLIYLYIWGERVYLSRDLSCSSRVTGRPYSGLFRKLVLIVSLPGLRSVLGLCNLLLNEDEAHRVLAKYDQTLDAKADHKIFFGRSLQTTANSSCPKSTIRCNINSSYVLFLRIPLLLPTGLSS